MALIDDVRKPRTENTTPLIQALAKPNSYGDAAAASANPNVAQVPTGGMKAPAPDGSQSNPLNNEIGRNVLNTLSALPGVGGVASRAGGGAAQVAGRALSTERALPAVWEVVQEGGALARSGGGAAQQLGQIAGGRGDAVARAASFAPQTQPAGLSGRAAQMLSAPSQGGQLAQRASTQVGEAAAEFAPRAASATQWADVVQPAALAAPQAAQSAAAAASAGAPGASRYAAGAGLGAAALLAGSANPGGTQLPAPGLLAQQPATAAKPNFFPGNSPDAGAAIYDGVGFGKSQPAPPAAPAQPNLAAQIPGQSARAPAPDGSQTDAWNTDLGRNVRNTAMAIPGAAGVGGIAATGGLISRGLSALAQGARVAGGAAGINAAQDVAQLHPANTSTGYNFSNTAGAGRGSVNPPLADPNAPRPTVAPPDNPNNITREGSSYSGGPNISGDITVNGKEAGGGFMVAPSQAYPSPGLMRQTAASQMTSAPQMQHSGNSFAARKALENAATSANSITNNGSGWDQHRGVSPARSAYAAMLKNDLDMQGAQPGVDVATMKENAATGRAAMQEGGQNSRFGQTQGIALSRLAMEQQTAGYQNRAAAQQEGLRDQMMQEQDPVKRQPIMQRLRELQGGQTADPYLVVPGGQGLTSDEKPYTMPSAVFNRQTQQWVQQPAQGGAQRAAPSELSTPSTRPAGTVSTINGKSAVWDGQKWTPRA